MLVNWNLNLHVEFDVISCWEGEFIEVDSVSLLWRTSLFDNPFDLFEPADLKGHKYILRSQHVG